MDEFEFPQYTKCLHRSPDLLHRVGVAERFFQCKFGLFPYFGHMKLDHFGRTGCLQSEMSLPRRCIFALLCLGFLFGNGLTAQIPPLGQADHPIVIYRDSSGGFVTDSFQHDFGKVQGLPSQIRKPFKWIGEEGIRIEKAFTGDPHFICAYPREALVPGKEYDLTICFSRSRWGEFTKTMGFVFSNGEIARFQIKGVVEGP